MLGILRITLAFSLLITTPLLHAEDDCSGPESHWGSVSDDSVTSGKPILVVFSSNNCGYCARLKEELIQPMLDKGELQQKVLVREFNIDTTGKVEDFDGLPVRTRSFVSRYDVFATPTVVILDPAGNRLGSPIVGYDNAQDYSQRLDRAIDEAEHSLRGASSV